MHAIEAAVSTSFPIHSHDVSLQHASALMIDLANNGRQLTKINAKIVEQIYSQNVPTITSPIPQDSLTKIAQLSWSLAEWRSALPPELELVDGDNLPEEGNGPVESLRFRVFLTSRYYYVSMVLNRPALLGLMSKRHINPKDPQDADTMHVSVMGRVVPSLFSLWGPEVAYNDPVMRMNPNPTFCSFDRQKQHAKISQGVEPQEQKSKFAQEPCTTATSQRSAIGLHTKISQTDDAKQ
jgi:hypothetical protein